ncbi:MAG: chitobiase/beta-hexosaminidase C-terminal domain-containing protein [Prevotella sp.]|nr:chitobiase/beta-hexosaminidase C-terminal domain-containing protein [Prevotella sp.]
MKQLQHMILMLCCLMLSPLTAWADDDPNTIVFQETFDNTSGTGGRDGKFSGSIAQGTIKYDNDGWASAVKCGGANQCVKFGTGSDNGVLTTPAISLDGASYALLTFSAAGWGDSNKNKLAITANAGFEMSGDNNITELVNEEWEEYSVLIRVTTGTSLQLTFTGKRGFLDDVVVRKITTVPTPTLPDDFTFFPNTTEEKASKHVMLTPVNYTVAYYTTDGSTPSSSNGTEALQTTGVPIHGTTTVKAIAYVGNMASEVVTKTYTQGNTVNGISAFCDLADGTEARIFLADDASHETRVLYYDETRHQLFVRENTKSLCVDFGNTATFSPTPQYNQHIGGWIVGKKATDNGMPKLVATDNTSTAFLAIANPVTESQTKPVEIAASDLSSYPADWVAVKEQRVGTDLAVTDRFGTGAYDGALTDLSGIVIATSPAQVAPVTQNSIPGVVYVLDESQAFTSPATDIANATVRLKRTLNEAYWNTFVVPFDIPNMNASIFEYTGSDGNTMHFTATTSIEAGIPYLIKPKEGNIIDQTYSDVTLTAQSAKSVDYGDYKFVATYSPVTLATDKTELFLTTDGKLAYPASASEATMKGMRAYFQVPASANVALFVDGEGTITGIEEIDNSQLTIDNVYNLNGQRVTQPRKGLFIVNGKKLIIH